MSIRLSTMSLGGFVLALFALLPSGGLAGSPDVVHHPDSSRPLAERWAWAMDRRPAEPFWIGYAIERTMEANSTIGSWRRHGAGPSLQHVLFGVDAARRTIEETAEEALARNAPTGAPRVFVRKPVALLFKLDAEGRRVLEVEISNLDLAVDLEDWMVYWLGPADDAASIALLKARFDAVEDAGVREEFVHAVGVHEDAAQTGPWLIAVLQGDDGPDVREKAAFWLGQSGHAGALGVLDVTARTDRSEDVREQAVFALSELDGSEALEALIALAYEADRQEVREKAIFWLGQRASRRAVDALEEVVARDPDVEVQKQAVFALSQQPADVSIPSLIEIARTHPHPTVRKQAIFWLGESGDERALAFLVELARGG